jgi:hypothetical protein
MLLDRNVIFVHSTVYVYLLKVTNFGEQPILRTNYLIIVAIVYISLELFCPSTMAFGRWISTTKVDN